MSKEIRFRQRFQNYEQSYKFLENTAKRADLTDIERTGFIKAFEMTFELAWKAMKDYLVSKGYDVQTPRDVIKQAFQIELIKNGETWLRGLNDRNLAVHLYDQQQALRLEEIIRKDYISLLKDLYETCSKIINESGTTD